MGSKDRGVPEQAPATQAADYGFRTVPLEEKQDMVDYVFDRVARRYDVMNDLMSAGAHRLWKSAMVSMLPIPRGGRRRIRALDVAGGTGDIAFRIAERCRGSAELTVVDINEAMLAVGRDRAAKAGLAEDIDFVLGNAEALPVSDGLYDTYTIAFGIRNVSRIDVALREAFRALKPGGRFVCLEFSTVDIPGLDRLYDAYSFNLVPFMGRIVAGDDEPYRYLVESIRRFPGPERFAAMIREAGFGRVQVRPLSGGIVALHSAWKI
ncbi:MAG: bifunctional demethylmenaquinone methyltransferase/2-methoxy-6-polyprenyl-1,4-benzoquinol methylase UbiE [Pseudomonadota bacterium]